MPESSAIAARPVASAAARALISAFAAYVSPSSGGLGMPSGSGSSCTDGRSRSNSRSLWALRVASSSRMAGASADGGGLELAQLVDAVLCQDEQLVQVRARERRAFS